MREAGVSSGDGWTTLRPDSQADVLRAESKARGLSRIRAFVLCGCSPFDANVSRITDGQDLIGYLLPQIAGDRT